MHLQGVKKSALAILGIFTGGAMGILRSGLASAGQFEQTTIAFETMLGSAKETQEILNDLTMFAAKTPFEMPEITQAAKGLIQFGERGEQLMETLRILGDAAAGSSTPFGFLALVFNQVRGVGKLLTQDFRQLSTRGILSMQDIADQFGISLSEAEKKLSSGSVKFEDVRKIFKKLSSEGGRFFNLMERQSTSLLGLGSTLNDAWNIMFRILATSLMPAAKAFTGIMIRMVETIQRFVQFTDGMAGSALAGATAMGVLGTAIFGLGQAAQFFGISWKEALIGSGIGIAMVALGVVAGVLIDKFNLMEKLGSAVGRGFDIAQTAATNLVEWLKVIYINWDGIWRQFPEVVAWAWSYISDINENFFSLFGQSMTYYFSAALDSVLQLFSKWGVSLASVWAKIFKSLPDLARNALMAPQTIGVLLATYTADIMSAVMDGMLQGMNDKAPDWSTLFDPSKETTKAEKRIGKLLEKMKREKMLFEKARSPQGKPIAPDMDKPTSAAGILKAGRYSLPEFSSKIQDKLLEGKNEQTALDTKRNGLLEMAITKQDQLITAVKDANLGGAAVLGAGD